MCLWCDQPPGFVTLWQYTQRYDPPWHLIVLTFLISMTMSLNDNSDTLLVNKLLTKHTKSGHLSQLPQSHKSEGILNPLVCGFIGNTDPSTIGTPLLQHWAPSQIVIELSPKPARCKVKSVDNKLAKLTSAFKRQCQSGISHHLPHTWTDLEAAPSIDVASDVFGSRSVCGEDMLHNGIDSRSEGSKSHSSEGFSDMEENNSDNEPLCAGKFSYWPSNWASNLSFDYLANVDVPAMRWANEWHNWAQFNVPAEQSMGGRTNCNNVHSNSPHVCNEHSTAGEGPAQQGSMVTSDVLGNGQRTNATNV